MRRFLADAASVLLAIALATPAVSADLGASPSDRRVKKTERRAVELRSRFDEPRPLDWGVSKPLPDEGCFKRKYLDEIVERFNYVQEKTWGTDIRMVAIGEPREIDFKVNGAYTMVDKVYCRARAKIVETAHAPARTHTVSYVVAEDAGIFGVVPDVDFCVAAYDHYRFRLHEPGCRVLNPY